MCVTDAAKRQLRTRCFSDGPKGVCRALGAGPRLVLEGIDLMHEGHQIEILSQGHLEMSGEVSKHRSPRIHDSGCTMGKSIRDS